MKKLIFLAHVRTLKHHPWQWILALFGVMMGVAAVVAIDLAETGAIRSFERATETLFGRATHRISSPNGLPESLYVQLRRAGFATLRPVVEGIVEELGSGKRLKLVGIDPVAELRFAPPWLGSSAAPAISWRRLILEPGAVLMHRKSGEPLGLTPGRWFEIKVGERRTKLRLAGWIETGRASPATLIADIATAQEVLAQLGRLHAIDVIIQKGSVLADLETRLPDGVEVSTGEAGSVSVRRMTAAFYTSLTALSLLALVVGMFLIYNIVGFMVVQRSPLFGILRVLGVTRRQIRNQVLAEAAVLGLAGSTLGLLAGVLFGQGMLAMLAQTIDQLYFPLPSARLPSSPWSLAKGLLLGLGATLSASWGPSLEAAKVQPVTMLMRSSAEQRMATRTPWLVFCGLILVVASWLLLQWTQGMLFGFVSLIALVLGGALCVPWLLGWMMGGFQWLGERLFGVAGRMPPRAVAASLSRTGVAAAALVVAIAITIGMTLMMHSFRDSVESWLRKRLDADLYVYQPASGIAGRAVLPRRLGRALARLDGVMGMGSVRYLRLATDRGFVRINAYELSFPAFSNFNLVEWVRGDLWQVFQFQDTVIVSEAYANLNHVRTGDWIRLSTPKGARRFRVVAVYEDYNAGRGIIAMSRATYERYWDDSGVSTYWLYLQPGVDRDKIIGQIQALVSGQTLEISDNRRLLRLSMEIFDQAFAVTGVLRWLATLVAFVGVFSALLALQLERTHEMGILRALGLTPAQVWRQVMAETGLLAGVAGLLAVPMGIVIGWVLIHVVHQRAFGWSLSLSLDWQPLLQGVLMALVAGLGAGIYPAWRMARTSPAEALRCE